jgi:osmoprotectant transport system substrate-binding protein
MTTPTARSVRRKFLLPVAVLGLSAVLAACGSSGSSGKADEPTSTPPGSTSPGSTTSARPTEPGKITIGSAAFPESELLANIYGDALAAKGVTVSKKLNIGERGVYIKALDDGSIDLVPEYSGSILPFLDSAATAKTPEDVYAALQTVAAAKGYEVLKYAAAQDSDTITVTKATADKYSLKSIGDLKDVAKDLTLGAPAQFQTRPDGVPGLQKTYGVTFGDFTATDAGGTVTVDALKNGSIGAADIFSTDPAIAANGFVSLEDPQSNFAAQNIIPLAKAGKLSQPAVDAANAVSAKLDTTTLAGLVAEVAGGKDSDAVAKAWLTSQGLA